MGYVVETGLGRFEGTVEGACVRFLGVPFAAPPIGERRFRPPEPPAPWAGVRPAMSVGAAAPQPAGLLQDVPPSAEDCLYLNIWTPRPDERRRPVMVWLHAGGFVAGSGGQATYDGAQLAVQGDVVVVTLNYRLGVLGFAYFEDLMPGHPELRNSANLALRDQLAALAWIQAHIDVFGGDPGNVTVFGGSAGAMCLSALLAAPHARGLFHRAVAQSGACEHAIPAEDATVVADLLLQRLGGSPSNPDVLWRASIEQLLDAQRACVRHPVRRGHPGHYHVVKQMGLGLVADGRLLPTDLSAAIGDGINRVPLLTGTNAEEWNYYVHLADRGKLSLVQDALWRVFEGRMPGRGAAAVRHYLSLPELAEAPAWRVFSAIETDRNFFAPACDLATRHARHAPTYTYLFERPSPLFQGAMGVSHAVEIPYVFGHVDTPLGRALCGDAPSARRMADAMLGSWVEFARTGRPGAVLGEAWLGYDSVYRYTMRLADEGKLATDPRAERRRFWMH